MDVGPSNCIVLSIGQGLSKTKLMQCVMSRDNLWVPWEFLILDASLNHNDSQILKFLITFLFRGNPIHTVNSLHNISQLTSFSANSGMYSMMANLTRHLVSSANSTMAGNNDCDSSLIPITALEQNKNKLMYFPI